MPGLERGLVREVILVDGGSKDATREIAEDAGCRVLDSPPGRARQLIAGAQAARGHWLLFLHADTWLTRDWADRARAHIATHPDKAATFRLVFRSDAREAAWLAGRANRRTRWFGLAYGDQGLLVSRALYDGVGGYRDIALMEDVALVRRIGRGRLRLLAAEAHTSAAKYERDGWRRRAYATAWRLARYLMGADPEELARHYS